MVKAEKENSVETRKNQGTGESVKKPTKIGPSTKYEEIGERLSPFGGVLGLIKFFDLVNFREIFEKFYLAPKRKPLLGHYYMVLGHLLLLFIGFNRVWHFQYIRTDALLCGAFGVFKLPVASTFWRYFKSTRFNQGQSLLTVMSALRERVWQLCEISHETIHIDFDTTVTTVYGSQEGARKGHNTKHRGKKGFRGVFGFIEETREYVVGKQRTGKTIGGEEFARLLKTVRKHVPGCVKNIIIRGDAEFMSWYSVQACVKEGLHFIFSNKQCEPPFPADGWYKPNQKVSFEYNECMYQPTDWGFPCRFVAMRLPQEESSEAGNVQLPLIEEAKWKVRIFVTDLRKRPHKVVKEYDKRADCENSIGEVQDEGIAAIPSKRFVNNYAYFQIVLLSYNIWRSFKLLAGKASVSLVDVEREGVEEEMKKPAIRGMSGKEIVSNTIRIARLKLLLIAAKVVSTGGQDKVKYSEHDSRMAGLFNFYRHIDDLRGKARPWLDPSRWRCKHMARLMPPAVAPVGSI